MWDGVRKRTLRSLQVEGEVVVLAAVLSPTRVASTVAHGYFLFLGRLSSSSKGTRCLEKLGVYQHLVSLVSMSSQDIYMKLVVSCLDYTKPGFARTLLTKVLTATSEVRFPSVSCGLRRSNGRGTRCTRLQ